MTWIKNTGSYLWYVGYMVYCCVTRRNPSGSKPKHRQIFSCDRRWTTEKSVVDTAKVDAEMLLLMNRARSAEGIAPLISHPALCAAALAHSQDMADNNELSHYGISAYSTWASRCLAAGYPGADLSTINEDIGAGQDSPSQLMGDYAQSPGHWRAIMSPEAQHAGSAAATGSDGWTYWCTDFGHVVRGGRGDRGSRLYL